MRLVVRCVCVCVNLFHYSTPRNTTHTKTRATRTTIKGHGAPDRTVLWLVLLVLLVLLRLWLLDVVGGGAHSVLGLRRGC
jgi:hypothetical protein